MSQGARAQGLDLFLASAALLVLELACIRWLPGNLRMLSFFSNFVLLACFLGMSLGLLRPGRRWLGSTLPLLLGVIAGLASLDLGIELAPATSSGSIYFGAELLEQAGLNLPFWLVLAPVFLLVTALFAGLGAELGRLFPRFPPLTAYSLNVGGSVAGILAFMAMSAASLGPLAWFGLAGLTVVWLLRDRAWLAGLSGLCLAGSLSLLAGMEGEALWSPYNRIEVRPRAIQGFPTQGLFVNGISHQDMYPREAPGGFFYDIPYVLSRLGRGARGPGEVLVIGAGSGNDVSHALLQGATAVDAVEIDPRIQELGVRLHPDRPYSDARVRPVVDDGRSFLRRSDRRYDWILYAYVDSLTLLSQFGAVRLENYLFTREAFEEVRSRLKPDGIFAAYNFYREAWLAVRIQRLLEEVFGRERVIFLTFPPREVVREDDREVNMAFFLAGDVAGIRQRLASGEVALTITPWNREAVGGALPAPQTVPLIPVSSVQASSLRPTTDDWPFPYLRRPEIPRHNLEALGLVLGLALALLGATGALRPGVGRAHFFFLGCAFMLIETRGIARLALLFGSTWTSNSLTFLAILSLILVANLVASRARGLSYPALYGGLLAALAVDAALPFELLLGLGPGPRAAAGCLVLFTPIFFAGLIFARSFRQSRTPARDLGANVLGSMVGGCLENLSLVLGYGWLVGVGASLYLLSWFSLRGGLGRSDPASPGEA